ncbi:alpha-mannosidase [Paenibacillus silviterrae]|uniref:alpha-mannosidase n=1 Tax=Paenibacillus silviterrae TaxID=3242194 RepID=UPI0025436863|nr:alpha-mannosidase [Paenibacillus chinjuensis]
MRWTKEKLAARIRELEAFRYREEREVPSMRKQWDPAGANGVYPPEDGEWSEARIGDRWSGRDLYMWLAFDCEIPADWMGKKVHGRFDFGQTGSGNNSGFESLLFLNGEPYQGVDSNHEEVFLPASSPGQTLQFRFRLWSGLNGYGKAAPIESQIKRAVIGWLDEDTDDLYYTGRAVLETVELLDENHADRHSLLSALDRAFLLLDWSSPGSEEFYRSVKEAAALLRTQLQEMPKHHPVTVRCIGHTHIDVAWLWRLRHTREKAARSFSTVLRLMEQYPDYIFLQTQPQLYAYLKEDYPELFERIRERVAEGRWEAGGAMWLEADCNLASGESLVRQLLYGTRFFREQFGVECNYLWLPDVFGYSWALPQILRKSGIDMFMTTKISWNQYNRMPHDTFQWRGIDGSEVLTHFITTPDPGGSEGAFYYTYNGSVTPQSVQGIWEGYRDKDINRNLLLAYGYGDGGGGVNREMLELRRRLEHMPGIPNVVTGRADEYFEQLKGAIAETDQYVHTWDGELYLELHRGTYTSQAYNKRANRKLELLYREAEWMSVLSSLLTSSETGRWAAYPKSFLDKGWQIILRNQFHDIIPGSSIGEVYEDSRAEYSEAFELGRSVCLDATARLTDGSGSGDICGLQEQLWLGSTEAEVNSAAAKEVPVNGEQRFTVLNSASWNRSGVVRIPLGVHGTWVDADQRSLAAQVKDGYSYLHLSEVPSMGYTTLTFVPGETKREEAELPFRQTENGLITPYYELSWNDKGQLIRLYDKKFRRDVLAEGQAGNVFQVFEDKPKSRHEAWDIDIFYQEKMSPVERLNRLTIEEIGPVRTVIALEWTYRQSVIRQNMIFYAQDRRIDFETKVDWHEQRQLLKVAFPVAIHAPEATYDIQFGNVKRPTHWNTSWDYARFESVAHQWADLSERNYGVSLLNDCKYGYDIKGNVMRLTLIKSAMVPDPNADQGNHLFTYSLLPHEGDWYQGDTVQSAWDLNQPLQVACGAPGNRSRFSFLSLSGDGEAFIDAIKKAEDEDGVIVRLHEYAGIRGEVRIASELPLASWQELDLMERPLGPKNEEAELSFYLKPYEIRTFLLTSK